MELFEKYGSKIWNFGNSNIVSNSIPYFFLEYSETRKFGNWKCHFSFQFRKQLDRISKSLEVRNFCTPLVKAGKENEKPSKQKLVEGEKEEKEDQKKDVEEEIVIVEEQQMEEKKEVENEREEEMVEDENQVKKLVNEEQNFEKIVCGFRRLN